ncbi:MAG: RluA family pseudouridine synthase [Alphaproteobacteria bacterium]|nr:RluA family pseudouridine synthase [Alphaproteobacteria bacterium]MCD8525927.1 RluA family pseudouridine synthase [Alphaproteobacteria bacterium]MCD8570452.1 RluA family pseudouridine synthase [Alphaproteobacteria bacterium]
MSERILVVADDDDGQRLDRWIKRHVPDLPYVLAQKLLRKGAIKVDGKKAKTDQRLSGGQSVRIPPFETAGPQKEKRARPLSDKDAAYIRSLVIFDDGDVIAINKPGDLAVQGGTGTERHVDGMLDALVNEAGVRPRLVHRLDKDTSGVLLLARSAACAKALGAAFKGRDIKKIYWALIAPVPDIHDGTIRAPLAKSTGNYEKMQVDEEEGKPAVTEYKIIENAGNKAAFAAFWPRTGRTHQIRIHAALLGSPVVGDGKYALKDEDGNRLDAALTQGMEGVSKALHLHAARIVLDHPLRKGVTLDISAPLPPALARSWKALGFSTNLKTDPFDELKR